ncbi:Histidinol dehydrogenase [Rhodopseudomonas palustris]|uniref:Histidinol dehydrogenase n=2 Tax=Rhodopseudomonas palustris (strain ATCC BAA-98 / CGA009) TaxID=258594 RepID=HISX_RHOPA|nr:histidinol dehydrogenase [Rhodopseudomonas palustris]P60861.1 RecName: Full=Histidinol dehydrogenase; Short=HDH [Rhodopseudomonas palustris CGA009]OPF96113.1 histidinol dehydrogenase [Rhodopseudomonas palustris]QQM06106.1 Histidinol dehydrogenase [Rhodopseudomonas palustris]RJF66697.1 histidinol dehydrogenase [Rhodopseudomonas palustris]WAB77424.1 histidinol dehydrogenase [Rhodopseudomonas palustris]WCL94735.1 histidinol dehydrogenase [Rhodopseudomonas palustris CGA009]
MPLRLDNASPDFASKFKAFLAMKREVAADIEAATRAIVDDVAHRGDAALLEATEKFDRLTLDAAGMRVGEAEVEAAVKACDSETVDALKLARDRIEFFHRRQLPKDDRFTDPLGVELGWRWSAIEAVGLYVPGGTAAYPSSVLMNAIPAKVAGVERVVMVVPSPGGTLNPLVLAAAQLAGATEIYRIGGAQAVAALAYGTATIAPVAKIVGPGNAYVAAAKRLVFGRVGIDMIAGPSEVVVVADKTANPDWIAADLLAQAEHDANAQSILITDSAVLAADVERALAAQLTTLPRVKIARASWDEFGAIIKVAKLEDAVPLANAIAAEHLEIMTADPEAFADKIRNAGAIFLGGHTPEAIGDYVGGSNHVLPTARSARFSSGLGVLDFMKRTSILKCGPEQLAVLGPAAMALGKAEGLDAHARSVGLRLNQR